MHRRTHAKRPVISAPIGPVQHLDGSGFSGTEALQGGAWVDYCEGNRSYMACNPSSSSDSLASRKSRRVSQSFPITEPPSASPTVVESDVSALTRIQTSNSSKASLGKKSAFLSLSRRSSSKQFPKYTLEARPESADNAENTLPLKGLENDADSSIPRSMRKWHKSKALKMLQFKTPFSRKALAAIQSLNPDHPQPDESELSASGSRSSESTLAQFPGSDTRPSPPANTAPKKPESEPQDGMYWAGRYRGYRDRLLTDMLNKGSFDASSSPHNTNGRWQTGPSLASPDRLTYLASSKTTSALPTVAYDPRPRLPDERDVDQRVSKHLESECTTKVAQESFKDYYALYACFEGGCAPYGKGQKSGLFAGVVNRFESDGKRREPKIKELTNSRSGAVGITPGRGVSVY
ncbi:hypothetical protein X797_000733 [Metarhizium robertsii]|uniref:S-adenosyl-L-methionine-dependent methyltransferase n=2 Tax=Metarhizium robertsii TaxID=568076 RepID=A0A0B2XJW5_METRA|nr:S-adenosyl-L-methionine-dependent methyltransferase [Metarhizium robertsii ARSEF 23]EXV06015.1 hypothetical protein X797_000733 [Metarhizium robertsii]KHO11747.1 S-adenosyl-L-methionine-dependent methyltransferase [Metarhizium robertsii ARSEF 23]